MSACLSVDFDSRPLERVEADVAVVTHFESDRPLRGAAARADWRLCGMLSDLLVSGRLSAQPGSVALAPTFGRMKAPRVLILGLGSRDTFGETELRAATREAIRRVIGLQLATVALPAPGDAARTLPLHHCAESILVGALDALGDLPVELHLRWVVTGETAPRVADALRNAARRAQRSGTPVRIVAAVPRRSPAPGSSPAGNPQARPTLSQRP